MMVQIKANERRLEEVVRDDVVRGPLAVQVAVDRQALGVVVAHRQPDRVAAGDIAVHQAAVQLVLLLVELVHQVAGAAAGRSLALGDAVGEAEQVVDRRAGGVGRLDVGVDPERLVGEVADVVDRGPVGLRHRLGPAGAGQRSDREVDVVLHQAAVHMAVLRDLLGLGRAGLGPAVDLAVADLAPAAVEVVEAVVLLVDHHDVLEAPDGLGAGRGLGGGGSSRAGQHRRRDQSGCGQSCPSSGKWVSSHVRASLVRPLRCGPAQDRTPGSPLCLVPSAAVSRYSTVTDLARLRGWSTSCPRALAISQANTCSGIVDSSGCRRVGDCGIRITTSAYGSTVVSPSSAITIVRAPRARTSWRFDTTLSCRMLRPRGDGTAVMTGTPSSIRAIGPCLSSPAAKPSACMYASSLSLSAPSSAVG